MKEKRRGGRQRAFSFVKIAIDFQKTFHLDRKFAERGGGVGIHFVPHRPLFPLLDSCPLRYEMALGETKK